MDSNHIVGIATPLLVLVVGVLYTFFPHWLCRKWLPDQQRRQRKLLRVFGPMFLVLGLVWLALRFMR